MLKLKSKQVLLFIGDTFVGLLALDIALALRFLSIPDEARLLTHITIFVPLFILTIIFYYSFDFYDFSPFTTKLRQVSRLINIHLLVLVLGFVYFYFFSVVLGLAPKTVLLLYTAAHVVLAATWRIVIVPSFLKPQARIKTLLIAAGEEYEELKQTVNVHGFYPFYFTDHLDVTGIDIARPESTLQKIKHILEENGISQVVIDIRDDRTGPLLSYLYTLAAQRKLHVFDAALVYQDILKKMPMRGVGHFWFFESVHLNTRSYEAVKRVVDVIVSLPLLIVYGIFFFPFVCLAIKLDDGGVIFSIQRRFGRGGKILDIYKIRTMTFTDEGQWVKHNKENKVTRVGAFLRKSRLDEFPQLWNVLIGDVSLVGPRPDILALGGQLSAEIPYYMMRYTVSPGLSGWAQVNQELPPNSVDETKIRLQYDLYYVKNRSLFLDFIVMVKTFRVLVLRTGI